MLVGLVFCDACLLTGRELKGSKAPRVQSADRRIKGQLLREEAGHRTEAAVRVANEARAELDPAAVEAEAGRPGKVAIGLRRELVAGAVHVQFLPADEPFGVGQNDGTDRETSETELVGHEDLASPTNGLAAMAHAELGGDDQDVALLRFGDEIERVRRASVNPQLRRRDLSLTVVVERPRGGDLGVNELDRLAVHLRRVGHFREVLRGQRVDRRNGEPSFGAVRECRQVLGELESLARIEIENLGKSLDLIRDRLGSFVLLRVHVVGTNFFVGVLVGHGQLGDELRDPVLQFATALVEPLCARIVELGLVVDGLEETDCVETFRVSAGDQCL